jgi:alkylation response protein AidB-like acyl-CoA dehydrogenase
MDFCLSPEEETLRREVERFVREEILPLEPLFERAPDIFEGSRWKSRAKLSRDPDVQRYITVMEGLKKKAEAADIWHLDVPKKYGGREVSNVAMIAATEELEKAAVPFELGNHVSTILYACKGDQIERFLLPCIRGEKTACFALTEPGAGSDPSMMTATAAPDGDDFVINGTKMFPTFGDVADFVQVFARLPGTKGREGVTCFLVDTGHPGYRVVRSVETIAGSEPCELVFDNCRIPKSQILGEAGKGWELNQAWLGARRFQVGIRCHGTAQRVLRRVAELLREEMRERDRWSSSLGHFHGELEALRAITYHGSWKADQRLDVRFEAACVKLFATELLHHVVDFALEAAGPAAFRKEHAIARAFRYARPRRIVEGASEIQRHMIQRALFREGIACMELQ